MIRRAKKNSPDAAVAACGFDARVRGETLELAQFAALSNALRVEMG